MNATLKKTLTWAAAGAALFLAGALVAFLYFIPPFTTMAPESLIGPEVAAPPPLDTIRDPAERMLAERGRYLVTVTGCTGCHTPQGPSGPDWNRYLAGGARFIEPDHGAAFSANLTPDPETGLARQSDEAVLRVLRSGVLPDGRVVGPRQMPWGIFSHWTEEDRRAVLAYLRHLKPVWHHVPAADPAAVAPDANAIEAGFAGKDYGQGKP